MSEAQLRVKLFWQRPSVGPGMLSWWQGACRAWVRLWVQSLALGGGRDTKFSSREKKNEQQRKEKKTTKVFALGEKSGSRFRRLCCVANHHWRAVGF